MPTSRRFSSDARRLRRRIQKRDARRRALDDDDGGASNASSPSTSPFGAITTRGAVDDDGRAWEDFAPLERAPRTGFFAMVFGLFKKRARLKPEERGAPAPSDDPVRRVLASPRGAARLDAFTSTLAELTPGTPGQKSVALAFHRELTTMAEEAGVNLTVLSTRVEACADALVNAGELERAGEILLLANKKERAAELFVEAGALEKLDEAHFDLALESRAGALESRLACERVETLLTVGRRAEALLVLARLRKRSANDAAVTQLVRTMRERTIGAERFSLVHEKHTVVVDATWPVSIGRGEESALPIKSPLISRIHAEIIVRDGRLWLMPRTPRGRLLVDDQPAETTPLHTTGTLGLDGIALQYRVESDALHLTATHGAHSTTLTAPRESTVRLVAPFPATITVNNDGAFLEPSGVTLGHDDVKTQTPLFVDDVLSVGDVRATVVRGRGRA